MRHGARTERKTTQSEMNCEEQRSALRAAVYRRDGAAVVHLLRGVGDYDDSLQLAGDGLIAAVNQRVDGAAELARDLVVALRRRGWDGDDELADELDALQGGPAPMLRALPVDLEELAGILEGDPLTAGMHEVCTGRTPPWVLSRIARCGSQRTGNGAIFECVSPRFGPCTTLVRQARRAET